VKIHIIGLGESKNLFIKTLRKKGIEVIYYGPIYNDDYKIKIFNKCSFGINMMKDSVMVGLTLKSIDYISAGLPLINNIKGDTYELVKDYKIGINVGSDLDLAAKEIAFMSNDNYRELRKNTLRIYNENFSEQIFRRKISDIVNNLIPELEKF
jgi:glycosyltransferase involved in cell wall biosynthesis